jgi:hypothetical protein
VLSYEHVTALRYCYPAIRTIRCFASRKGAIRTAIH